MSVLKNNKKILIAGLVILFNIFMFQSADAQVVDRGTANTWFNNSPGAIARMSYSGGSVSQQFPVTLNRVIAAISGTAYILDNVTVDTSNLGTLTWPGIGTYPRDIVCIMPAYEGVSQSDLYMSLTYAYAFFTTSAQCQRVTGNIVNFSFFRTLAEGSSFKNEYMIFAGSDFLHFYPQYANFQPGAFNLTGYGAGGITTSSVGDGGYVSAVTAPSAPAVQISISPGTTIPGHYVTISYSNFPSHFESPADTCTASSNVSGGLASWNGSVPVSNSGWSPWISVGPLSTTTIFYLSCSNAYGTRTVSADVLVRSPDFTFSVSPSTVAQGKQTSISWVLSSGQPLDSFDSCTASSNPNLTVSSGFGWSGSVATFSGSPSQLRTVNPLNSSTLSLTCNYGANSVTKTTDLTVTPNHAPTAPIISGPNSGDIGTYTFDIYSTDEDGDFITFGRSLFSGFWRESSALVPFDTPSTWSSGTRSYDVPSNTHVKRQITFSSYGSNTFFAIARDQNGVNSAQSQFTFNAQFSANGSCGVAGNGTNSYTSAPVSNPSNNLCNVTSTTPVVSGNGVNTPWTWTCTGNIALNTNASCSANLKGSCGTATGNPESSTPPSSNLCNSGSASAVSAGGSNWTWSCNGTGPSSNNVSCQAPMTAATAGVCGIANNKSRVVEPSVLEKCSVGLPINQTSNSSRWQWKCDSNPTGGTQSGVCRTNKLNIDYINQ